MKRPIACLKRPGSRGCRSGVDGQKARGREALDPELKAPPSFDGVKHDLVVNGILRRPARGMGAPVDVECGLTLIKGHQDERGSTQMVGRADDLGGAPTMLAHDLRRVIDVLHGVLGLGLFNDVGSWHTLASCELRHSMGFDEMIVSRASRHDDMRCDPGLELSNTFKDSFALLWRRSSIEARWGAKDDDRVEVLCAGVMSGNR